MAASRWKNSMQRHLRMVECSEVQKQFLATFKLTGVALHWWESITTSEQRDALPISDFGNSLTEGIFLPRSRRK